MWKCNIGWKISLVLVGFVLLITNSCSKKEENNKPEVIIPVITTSNVFSIRQTTASCTGEITNNGGSTIMARGVCWGTGQTPTILDNKTSDSTLTGSCTSNLTLLTANTTYYARAYATNIAGTGYGNIVSFTTHVIETPTITTTIPKANNQTTATCGGNITSDGGSEIIARGVCWSIEHTPTIDDYKTSESVGVDSFISNLSGLKANTKYIIRAYATNSIGTSYGGTMFFTTPHDTITDIDGNVYNLVTIGTQVWMATNLRTTKYRNGDLIGTTASPTSDISGETTPKYQWACNGDDNNLTSYGRLYTWYAVTDSRNVCPSGSHLPSNDEWQILVHYLLDINNNVGGKLKEIGEAHWESPNKGATDEVGFTALPAGGRTDIGNFYEIGYNGLWWTTTEYDSQNAVLDVIDWFYGDEAYSYTLKSSGLSVRCVKD